MLFRSNAQVANLLERGSHTPDPFLQDAGDWLNYNRYGYVFNNPLKYTDPSGYQKKVCDSDHEGLMELPSGLQDFFLRNACSGGGSGMNLGPSVFSPYRWITGNVYLNTDGEVVSYAEVYNNYILPNGTNFTGQSASAVFEKMSDGYNIYHITYKPGNIDAYVFANGDIGTVTPDACGALYISNPFAGMMAGVNASMFADGGDMNWSKLLLDGSVAFGSIYQSEKYITNIIGNGRYVSSTGNVYNIIRGVPEVKNYGVKIGAGQAANALKPLARTINIAGGIATLYTVNEFIQNPNVSDGVGIVGGVASYVWWEAGPISLFVQSQITCAKIGVEQRRWNILNGHSPDFMVYNPTLGDYTNIVW